MQAGCVASEWLSVAAEYEEILWRVFICLFGSCHSTNAYKDLWYRQLRLQPTQPYTKYSARFGLKNKSMKSDQNVAFMIY